MAESAREKLLRIYELLLKSYGPRRWWPADTPFEVAVGAILTQSTSWANVEKAIQNLKTEGVLSLDGLHKVRTSLLSRIIRPSLYHNVKAKKLKAFVEFLKEECIGDILTLSELDTDEARTQLLNIWGVGPETADSILLYALGRPSFVVDAYTRRIFEQLGVLSGGESYDEVKKVFEENLPADTPLYNEYHALIVEHAKQHCKTKPECTGCPIKKFCQNPD